MELILAENAYKLIINECMSAPETETGGILIGKKINEQRMVVPFALGPGIKAKRSCIRFSPDVEWQQIFLDKLFNRYGVNYVGSYHRHPGNNFLPSAHDFKAACHIVTDTEWNVEEAVFPIINIINLIDKKISFHPYHFSRGSMQFQSIGWRIVSHKDPLIQQVLKEVTHETENHHTT
jgi:integrative and conjugative element protein (TIGR02256 family)